MKKKNNLTAFGSTAILMTVLLVGQKVLGMLRETLLANYYGASSIIDTLSMSTSIATISLGLVYHLTSPFTPIYAELVESGKKEEAKGFMDTLFTYIGVFGLLICGATLLLAEPIVHLMAPGFSPEAIEETIRFLYANIWHRLFFIGSHFLLCYLHYHGRFIIPRFCFLLISAVEIVMILLSVWVDQRFLAWSATIAYGSVFVGFLAAVRSRGYRPTFRVAYTEHIHKAVLMLLPGLFSLSISYINSVIDKNFASALPEGSISAFGYSGVLIESLYVLFSTSIIAMATPQISKYVARNDTPMVCEAVRSSLTTQLILMIPVAIGGALLSKEIISLMYERGAFDASATEKTAVIFAIASFGLITRVVSTILGHVVYSHRQVVLPTIVGVFSTVVNIVLNWIWIKPYGYVGLAMATLISGAISVPSNIILNRKYLHGFPVRRCVTTIAKCFVGALLMGGAVIGIRMLLPMPEVCGTIAKLVYLLIYVGAGALAYGICLYLMKVSEIRDLVDGVISRLKKKVKKDRAEN